MIDHSWPGHCDNCHKKVKFLHPLKWKTNMNTVAVTALCNTCIKAVNPSMKEKLRLSIVKGWEKEKDMLNTREALLHYERYKDIKLIKIVP